MIEIKSKKREMGQVEEMKMMIQELKQQVEETKKKSAIDEVYEAERAVKDEANKKEEVLSLDNLHSKLVRLDEVARRAQVKKAAHYSAVLARFVHCRSRNTPNLGQLISSFLSTPEENTLLEKERKFYKGRSDEGKQANVQVPPASIPAGPSPWYQGNPQQWGPVQWYGPGYGPQEFNPMAPPQFQGPRPRSNPRGGGTTFRRGGMRAQRDERCFNCKQLGHYMRDCKNK